MITPTPPSIHTQAKVWTQQIAKVNSTERDPRGSQSKDPRENKNCTDTNVIDRVAKESFLYTHFLASNIRNRLRSKLLPPSVQRPGRWQRRDGWPDGCHRLCRDPAGRNLGQISLEIQYPRLYRGIIGRNLGPLLQLLFGRCGRNRIKNK